MLLTNIVTIPATFRPSKNRPHSLSKWAHQGKPGAEWWRRREEWSLPSLCAYRKNGDTGPSINGDTGSTRGFSSSRGQDRALQGAKSSHGEFGYRGPMPTIPANGHGLAQEADSRGRQGLGKAVLEIAPPRAAQGLSRIIGIMSTNGPSRPSVINNLAISIIASFVGIHTVAKAAFSPRGFEWRWRCESVMVNFGGQGEGGGSPPPKWFRIIWGPLGQHPLRLGFNF